jgi:hypothetical protein
MIFAALQLPDAENTSFPTPAHFTFDSLSSNGYILACHEIVASHGPSDALYSETYGGHTWNVIELELKGGTGGDDVEYSPTVKRDTTFVNAGSTTGAVSTTSGAPALPGSRVNGNLLIAFINTTVGSETFSVGNGWTIGDTSTDTFTSSAWAWRIVDGTEVAPPFTWGTTATWHGRVYQFSGTFASPPIGAKRNNLGTSTNLNISNITTTSDLSMVFAVLLTTSNSQVIPLPTNFTAAGATFNDSNGSDRACYEYKTPTGTVSDSISLTITSAHWHAFLIEITRQ